MHTATATTLALAPEDIRVLVAGGWNGEAQEQNGELYDPVAETWSPTSGMVEVRAQHSAAPMADGRRVLVAGGTGPR